MEASQSNSDFRLMTSAPDRAAPEAPLAGRVILQVVPELETGGVERTTVDVAAGIVAAGGRALVASRGGRLEAALAAVGGELLPMPVHSKNPATVAMNVARLIRVVRTDGVDLVHARSRMPAWSALLAARATDRPFVTTQAGAHGQSNALKAFYNSVMARGDAVIANSAWTARELVARFPSAAPRVTVIERGTDLARFSRAGVTRERTEALRAAWGLAPGDRVVLKLARLTRWKGQAVVVEAARRLAAEGRLDGVVVVLAGDAQGRDGYRAELEAAIRAGGLEGRVRLVGHCEDPAAAMALADVAVVASTAPEAFGRAAVEAEALGTPVVVSDHGAVPETVLAPPDVAPEARTGWRVPPGDAAAAAAAIGAALALSPEERTAMSARARAHVEARFSLDLMVARTIEVYRRLLDRAR